MRTARALWEVVRRPQWIVIGVTLLFGAVAGQSASQAASLLSLIVAMAMASLALHILGLRSMTPWAVLRSLTDTPSVWRLIGASLVLAFLIAFLKVVPLLLQVATWTANAVSGDPDLTVALVVAICMAIVATVIRSVGALEVRLIERGNGVEGSAEDRHRIEILSSLRQSIAFWDEAAKLLAFAVIALVPAALLANWAWNVAASVALPLLVLSVGRARKLAADPPDSSDAADAASKSALTDD